MSRKAMQLALEALESDPISHTGIVSRKQAIAALRQALETEQEPVAWITNGGKGELWWYQSSKFDEEGNLIGYNPDDVPLYTAPPKKQWVGLTLKEILINRHLIDWTSERSYLEFAREIERALKEKNT